MVTRNRTSTVLVLATASMTLTTAVRPQEPSTLSLREVPRPVPAAAIIPAPGRPGPDNPIPGPETPLPFRDLVAAGIVKDQGALIRLGKAFFWDMQVGSDGVQACASCHFHAGADNRSRNQISPGLSDKDFPGTADFPGDHSFGNSTVPYTANDPATPSPPGPVPSAPAKLDVPGFPQFGPNRQLTAGDFPLNGWLRPTELTPRGGDTTLLDEAANVSRDTNDVISSQGVRHTLFQSVKPGQAVDAGTDAPDIFNTAKPGDFDTATRIRRVPGRNAPTVINAVFNFDNFWDGRASYIFNGVNPFGFRDRQSTVKQVQGGKLQDVFLRITNSSLASQAVGPAVSNFEMSWENRAFPDIGKKLLSLRPLAKQVVHPDDSVLGRLSQARADASGSAHGRPGLNVPTYAEMVKAAFQDRWWDYEYYVQEDRSTRHVERGSHNNERTIVRSPGYGEAMEGLRIGPGMKGNQYTLMQWNFSLFWGLAVQAYEATLVSDDTPFDRFQGAPSKGVKPNRDALDARERNGLSLFMDADPDRGARCNNCHVAPIMTNHTIAEIVGDDAMRPDFQGRPTDIVEFMTMGDGSSANYDKGFYNIGVRRTPEDSGRAGTAPDLPPFRNPKDGDKPFPLSYAALAQLAKDKKLPPDVQRFIQLDPVTHEPPPVLDRQAIHGNFKVPNLRNVRLTGPYFHNGDSATLRQVVEFYTRGGNFPNTNLADLDTDIHGIPALRFPEFRPSAQQNIEDLVRFVSHGLTDERVALEKAPFDHPALSVPNGAKPGRPAEDERKEIAAVGRNGNKAPLATFLDLDPQAPH